MGVKLLSHPRAFSDESATATELTFVHADPGKVETLVMRQAERSLAAFVDLKGDEPDPFPVVLQPAGTVTERLVDQEGRPRPNRELGLSYQINTHGRSMGNLGFQPTTGSDGRFRIKNLVPGIEYSVNVMKKNEPNFSFLAEGYLHKTWWTIKSGETQDWGDVQVQSFRR